MGIVCEPLPRITLTARNFSGRRPMGPGHHCTLDEAGRSLIGCSGFRGLSSNCECKAKQVEGPKQAADVNIRVCVLDNLDGSTYCIAAVQRQF